jgi:hypothetical protein
MIIYHHQFLSNLMVRMIFTSSSGPLGAIRLLSAIELWTSVLTIKCLFSVSFRLYANSQPYCSVLTDDAYLVFGDVAHSKIYYKKNTLPSVLQFDTRQSYRYRFPTVRATFFFCRGPGDTWQRLCRVPEIKHSAKQALPAEF